MDFKGTLGRGISSSKNVLIEVGLARNTASEHSFIVKLEYLFEMNMLL